MERLMVERGKWDVQAALWLTPALPVDPDFTIDDLAFSVQAEESALFHIHSKGGDRVGDFVLRKDGQEMVMVAVGGHLKGGSITRIFTPYVEEVARQNGCVSMRAHTRKKGIEKLMLRAGWEPSEVIYRKAVDCGRKVIQ